MSLPPYELFADAFNCIPQAVVLTDQHHRILFWNRTADRLLHLGSGLELSSAENLFPARDGYPGWLAETEIALRDGMSISSCFIDSNAGDFWSEGTLTVVYGADGQQCGFVKVLYDATRKRQEELALLSAAASDSLTGLANRQAFDARLLESVLAELRSDQTVVLHLIDLDGFKEINDTLGHHSGDLLLKMVAGRISRAARKTDFVARLGGDEFGLIQFAVTSEAAGGLLADKILRSLSAPFDLHGSEAQISASIGISVVPGDGCDSQELLRKADAALYRVKRNGRNGYSYFSDELDRQAHQRGADIVALRDAMRTGQFHLAYQPKIEAASGALMGIEALLRCDHPGLSERPTHEIVALAKSCGAMLLLTKWILSTACNQAAAWKSRGHPPFKLSLNFCSKELSNTAILDMIDGALSESGLPPSALELEITETELLNSKESGLAVLQQLRARGVSIALDDFGTGYSSLSYLTTLPVDIIKLDMSFVRSLANGPRSAKIVMGIVGLAKSLNLKIVAEGVEDHEQFDFFNQIDEMYVQGFHICHPLIAPDMSAWLSKYPSRAPVAISDGRPASNRNVNPD